MDFEERLKEIYTEPELPAVLSDTYDIVSCLKHSDERQVFLIKEKNDNKKYILKCAGKKYSSLLHKEYDLLQKAAKLIKCPEPVSFIENENNSFLIKEYIDGKTLKERVEDNVLSDQEIIDVISGLSTDIEKLHSLNPPIILRDIKPENIVISNEEYIIIDFDASREYDKTASSDTEYVGTRATAAPEQFGYSQTDARTDIYAIGMLMLYMKTGSFDRDIPVSSKLDKVIKKCIAFSPSERYSSIAELKKALEFKPNKTTAVLIAVAAIAVLAAIIFIVSKPEATAADIPAIPPETTTTALSETAEITTEITEETESTTAAEEELPVTVNDVIEYTHNSDSGQHSLELIPYMPAKDIEYMTMDIEINGTANISVGGWTDSEKQNWTCSDTSEALDNYSGNIRFELGENVSNGRIASDEIQLVMNDITNGTNIKINKITYYGDINKNVFTYTKQAESFSDEMVSEALALIDNQNHMELVTENSEADLIEFMLKDSDYAVFGGKEWPAISTTDERYFIPTVTDSALAEIYLSDTLTLDSNSSASMSAGWFVSGVVYSQNISLNSYRVYIFGETANYKSDEIRDDFKKRLQAGEHLRIDETRSMSFISCNDDGFYFIEYGSENNSDHNLRLRYYSFDEFTEYLNALNKQLWYYEINENLN